jgi:hypothetical protein
MHIRRILNSQIVKNDYYRLVDWKRPWDSSHGQGIRQLAPLGQKEYTNMIEWIVCNVHTVCFHSSLERSANVINLSDPVIELPVGSIKLDSQSKY